MSQPMRCAQCGGDRLWPKDFPVKLYAVCWACHHLDEEAKPRPWYRDLVFMGRVACILWGLVLLVAFLRWWFR